MRMLILLACAASPDIQVTRTPPDASDSGVETVIETTDTAPVGDTAEAMDTAPVDTAPPADTAAPVDTGEPAPPEPSCWVDDGESVPTTLNVGFVAGNGHDGMTATVSMDQDTGTVSVTLPSCGIILAVTCVNGTATGAASVSSAEYGEPVTYTLTQTMNLPYGQGFSDRCAVEAEGVVAGEASWVSDVIYVYY